MSKTKQHDGVQADAYEITVTEQELKMIDIVRNVGYGEVQIFIKDFEIVRIAEKKSIKL